MSRCSYRETRAPLQWSPILAFLSSGEQTYASADDKSNDLPTVLPIVSWGCDVGVRNGLQSWRDRRRRRRDISNGERVRGGFFREGRVFRD